MDTSSETLELDPEQRRAADAVAALRREEAPAGLAQRTLRFLAEGRPARRVFWMLRPITHPVARLAAAAAIILAFMPITDLDTATLLGKRIEERVTGEKMTARVEGVLDRLLAYKGTPNYSPAELAPFTADQSLPRKRPKFRPAAAPSERNPS